MIKISCLLTVAFFSVVFKILGQKSETPKDYLSVEIGTSYYNYPEGEYDTGKFNYGFHALLSGHLVRIFRLSVGIGYATRNFSAPGSLYRRTSGYDHHVTYLNIPVMMHVQLTSGKGFKSGMMLGFLVQKLRDYDVKLYNWDGSVNEYDSIIENKGSSNFFIFGYTFSVPVSNRLKINATPSAGIILNSDDDIVFINNVVLSDYNRLFLAFNVGVELKLSTK